MSGTLLKYFKPVSSKATRNERLPDPDSSLRLVVPSSSIARANELVMEVLEQSERGPYVKLTGAQRYQIGKRAAEHGVTAAICYFKKKFPDLPLKETTVRRLKNLYHQELLTKPLKLGDDIVPELLPMKRGRPLLIGDELDRQVREYILDTRRVGGDINTAVVIAGGTGIVMSQNPSLLKGMKDGKLTKDWANYVLQLMGFVKGKQQQRLRLMSKILKKSKNCFYLM